MHGTLTRWLCAGMGALALLGLPAHSAIVEFGLAGANAAKAPTLNATHHDPGVGVTPLSAIGTSGALDYPRTLLFSSWPTAASGLDMRQYYEFTVTVDDGHVVDYRSMTLSVASGGHGRPALAIHASTDAFVESDVVLQALHYEANTTVQTLADLDITPLGKQTGPVTFRIFLEKGDSGFAGILHTDAFGGGTSVIVDGVVEAP